MSSFQGCLNILNWVPTLQRCEYRDVLISGVLEYIELGPYATKVDVLISGVLEYIELGPYVTKV